MEMKLFVVCIIAGLLVFACGCVEEEKEEGETHAEMSFVTFQITDKVTEDFDHVNVTFSEIKLHEEIDEENKAWVIVDFEPKEVDLVALNLSQLIETLGVAEIEVGNYSKLWINVSECKGVLNSTGEEVNITVPSSWLKIQQLHLFNVTRGNHTILIDIDLEGSIHSFHGGQEYKFIPVISSMEHRHENQLKFREHEHSKIRNMVGNRAPAIDILVNETLVKNNAWVNPDEEVEFNASATLDIEGDEITFTWDFGDGSETATGAVVNHTFSDEKNNYKVTLTVTDGKDEAIAVITINVHINN
jgi:hypothetical protein